MSPYVTLPSAASAGDFPANTNLDFTVRLGQSFRFEQELWEVALVDMHYPNTWNNIVEGTLSVDRREVSGACWIRSRQT